MGDLRFEVAAGEQALLLIGTSLSGDADLIKSGDGWLIVQSSSTYTGATQVLEGALFVSGENERLPDTTDLSISTGAELRMIAGMTETVGSLAGDGKVRFMSGTNQLIVGGNNTDTTFSGTIEDFTPGSGTGRLTKIGTGTLTLSGTNTFSGTLLVTDGGLAISSDANLGDVSSILSLGDFDDFPTLRFDADMTLSAARTMFIGFASGPTFDTNGNNVTVASSFGSSDGSLRKSGAGTLTLSGSNAFAGPSVEEGKLVLAHNNAAGVGSTQLKGGVLGYASGVTNSKNINLWVNSEVNVESGSATQSGVIDEVNPSIGITKTGAGTLILSAANTYTGGTTISGGTLTLAHNNAGNGDRHRNSIGRDQRIRRLVRRYQDRRRHAHAQCQQLLLRRDDDQRWCADGVCRQQSRRR